MGKISTYITDSSVTLADKVIGTDAENSNETKNYLLSDVYDLFAAQSSASQNLGTPIFQPQNITYSEEKVSGILVNMVNSNTFCSSYINAPNLNEVYGNIFLRGNSETSPPVLMSIYFPLLQSIGTATNFFVDYGLRVTDFPILASIGVDQLSYCHGAIYISNVPYLTQLNLSSLTTIAQTLSDGLIITDNAVLSSLNINSLSSCDGDFSIQNNPLLTSIDITSLTIFNDSFYCDGNAFTQTCVDSILNQLANVVALSGQTVDLSGGTNAAPSVTGAGYVATLVSNGCIVTTN